jgi:DNA-binding GntR family transcriptional regulator
MTTPMTTPMMADVDDDQDDTVRSARAKLEVAAVQLVAARMVGCDGGFDSRSW